MMKFREVRKLFKESGWSVIRQSGSHEQWYKLGEIETIAGQDAQEVPKGLLNTYLKRLGLK
jgi:predicted RNA binding protein YcfA (HicA-like mRNA interferase family)